MQKSTLSTLFREEIKRGLIFGGTFLVIVVATMSSISHAASGGMFGNILEKILGLPTGTLASYNGDGTVKNAQTLSGHTADEFQKIAAPNQSCGGGQCIYGFDPSGNILCR